MSKVYLVPSVLDDLAMHTIPTYLIDAVKDCIINESKIGKTHKVIVNRYT